MAQGKAGVYVLGIVGGREGGHHKLALDGLQEAGASRAVFAQVRTMRSHPEPNQEAAALWLGPRHVHSLPSRDAMTQNFPIDGAAPQA